MAFLEECSTTYCGSCKQDPCRCIIYDENGTNGVITETSGWYDRRYDESLQQASNQEEAPTADEAPADSFADFDYQPSERARNPRDRAPRTNPSTGYRPSRYS